MKLYKFLWTTHILPNLDEKSLLAFSAVSKETRQIAFHELFNRPNFKRGIYTIVSSDPIVDHRHYDYLYSNAMYDLYGNGVALRILQGSCIGASVIAQYLLQEEAFQTIIPIHLFSLYLFLIFRHAFLYCNQEAITKYHNELNMIKKNEIKSDRLKYLRDELPKQSIITKHSLFRKFIDTSAESEPVPSCTIL